MQSISSSTDLEGHVVYLTATHDSDLPQERVFLVSGGFGANPDSLGTKVYGKFLHTGEAAYVRRHEVMGILTPAERSAALDDNRDPIPLGPVVWPTDPDSDTVTQLMRDSAMRTVLALLTDEGRDNQTQFSQLETIALMQKAYLTGVTDGNES